MRGVVAKPATAGNKVSEDAEGYRATEGTTRAKGGERQKENRTIMIKGIHHVSMKCRPEQQEKVRDFYCKMLELPVCAEWETGFLLDTPAGKVEFFY